MQWLLYGNVEPSAATEQSSGGQFGQIGSAFVGFVCGDGDVDCVVFGGNTVQLKQLSISFIWADDFWFVSISNMKIVRETGKSKKIRLPKKNEIFFISHK